MTLDLPAAGVSSKDRMQDRLAKILSEVSSVPSGKINAATLLASLGVDSIDAPGLVEEISEMSGKKFVLADLFGAETVGDLMNQLSDVSRPIEPVSLTDAHADADFARFVNPHLADRLRRLSLDRNYVTGKGLWLRDAEGHDVLDFTAQYGALPFGYNDPHMWAAVHSVERQALPGFAQASLLTSAGALARALVEIAPSGLDRVTFVNSGAEATEVAIKLARARTGRSGVVSTTGSFHGKTLAALSATGREKYQKPFGLPSAEYVKIPFGDLDALENSLSNCVDRPALFITEPIQGEGGIHPAPDSYLRAAADLCRRHGVLFAIDEVQTGLGRTGQMLATPSDIEPDILTLAKALSGGLVPIGACLCRANIHTEEFGLNHSSTFAGGTLGAEIGRAVLNRLQADDCALLAAVRLRGRKLKDGLQDIGRANPELIADVRGTGLMLGVEFAALRKRNSDSMLAISADQEEFAPLFAAYMLNRHNVRTAYALNNGNVMRVQPALTVSDAECDRFLDAFAETAKTFATFDLARILSPVYSHTPTPQPQNARLPRRFRPLSIPARPGEPVFAFLYHPTTTADFAFTDPSFPQLTPGLQEQFSCNLTELFDPFVVGETRFATKNGKTARGVQIIFPYTADQMLQKPRADIDKAFGHALSLARDHGATRLGLGAFTSIVSAGGMHLRNKGFFLTTGNGLTAVAGVEQLGRELSQKGSPLSQATIAVVGAGGSVGRAVALLLARRTKRLILIGNRSNSDKSLSRLNDVARSIATLVQEVQQASNQDMRTSRAKAMAAELIEQGRLVITTDLDALHSADGAVVAVSAPQPFLRLGQFRPGAIVCDLSRPGAFHQTDARQQENVTVIPAGLIRMPHSTDGGPFGLPIGEIYACMAETVLLSIADIGRDVSLGRDIPFGDLDMLTQLATRYGFEFV